MVYERGEDVLQEEPFAYCVIADNRSLVCDFCLRIANYKEDLKICSACKVVHYCDKYCQKKGWRSHHRSECKFIKNSKKHLRIRNKPITNNVRYGRGMGKQ